MLFASSVFNFSCFERMGCGFLALVDVDVDIVVDTISRLILLLFYTSAINRKKRQISQVFYESETTLRITQKKKKNTSKGLRSSANVLHFF